MSTSATRADFLFGLHEGCEGLAELRALPSEARTFVRLGDDQAVARFVDAHPHENTYVAVATRKDATSGKLENCHHLSALFVDIDYKITAEVEARERLRRFPLTPSAIVFTGGGLHPYWFLREPLSVAEEGAVVRSLLRRLAHALGGDLAAARAHTR